MAVRRFVGALARRAVEALARRFVEVLAMLTVDAPVVIIALAAESVELVAIVAQRVEEAAVLIPSLVLPAVGALVRRFGGSQMRLNVPALFGAAVQALRGLGAQVLPRIEV
ncbi:unnamed protein product [Prorocentrum cordatum]|uniref:Uncharacterized protein n=1 Tax=Prorocentrum cordatum TaxID=2364126 RepID=A0ABN9PSZ1_9DINO|nr:unnamed protein product [Polarella glacialis]